MSWHVPVCLLRCPFPACRCGMFFRQQGFLTACCGLYVRTYAAGKAQKQRRSKLPRLLLLSVGDLRVLLCKCRGNICAAAVSLKLYLFHREYLPVTVPIVFKCNIIHNFHSVQENRNFFSTHYYMETVPFSKFVVCHLRRFAFVLLIVVKSSRTYLCAHVNTRRVPNLHLRSAAKIDACVGFCALGVEFPVHIHLEVAVFLNGAEVFKAVSP